MPYVIVPAALIAAALLLYLFLIFPARCPKDALLWLQNTHFAHRGLHDNDAGLPENSTAAFIKARESGFGAELDVNLSQDGRVVVFHDDRLARMTGRDTKLCDLAYEELSQLRLLGTDHPIPLFEEMLVAAAGLPLIVELKSCSRLNELCEKTLKLLRNYPGKWCIESFDPGIVRWFRKHAPDVVRGQLVAVTKKGANRSALRVFLYNRLLLNFYNRPHFMACEFKSYRNRFCLKFARALGAAAVAWTCRSEADHRSCAGKFDSVIFEHYDPKSIA